MHTVRKGKLKEIISKALYYDKPGLYTITYRDKDKYPEIPLEEFIAMDFIPITRIIKISRNGITIWSKKLQK